MVLTGVPTQDFEDRTSATVVDWKKWRRRGARRLPGWNQELFPPRHGPRRCSKAGLPTGRKPELPPSPGTPWARPPLLCLFLPSAIFRFPLFSPLASLPLSYLRLLVRVRKDSFYRVWRMLGATVASPGCLRLFDPNGGPRCWGRGGGHFKDRRAVLSRLRAQ